LSLVLLAATLAGLVPGRGQALPAQRGNLLAGAAFGTVQVRGGSVRLTLSPARPGLNTIAATPAGASRTISVTLTCACAGAAGRFDARGGLPGARKVVLRVEDDGGDPVRAAQLVRARRGAIALLAPCGTGAVGALRAAGDLPAVAADPSTAPAGGTRTWRTA